MLPGLETVQYILAFKVAVLIYSLYSLNAVGTFVLYGYGKVTVCAWVVLACSCATLAAIALGASIAGLLGAIAGNSIFIFTVFLLNLAMKYVKEDGFAWLTWIKVPLIIFTIGTLCQLLIKMENPLRWVILIAQCSAIVLWAYFHLFSGMSAKLLHLVPKRWLATSNKQKV
jgi:O-antigen/teichoic acid export membrane protein